MSDIFGVQERTAVLDDIRFDNIRLPIDRPGLETEVSSPVYAGGTLDRPTEEATATPVVTPSGPSAPLAFSPNPDARNTIKAVLASYGLDALSDILWSNYTGGLVDVTNPQALIYSIRNEPAYKERFKVNDVRMKAGLPELSPGEYISLEDQYRQVIRSNGLPTGFYDTADDITKLISGDVSPSEFQSRITNGYNAVANADPEVRRQMQDLYGVSEGGLAAYFQRHHTNQIGRAHV